jgi:hypothetical protein
MSIIVACPNCRKRYAVNEKFAGKSGHCPNCKNPIRVPIPAAEVKIHVPKHAAGGSRSSAELPILKPIAREQVKFNPVMAAAVVSVAVALFMVAFLAGRAGLLDHNHLLTATALLILSPLLAWAGYGVVYDDELEPYRSKPLLIRSAICGLSYAALWAIFAFLADGALTGEVWNWLFIAPPFLAAGTLVAVNTFDLEYGNGFFHYSFYLLVIVLLRWAAGLGWIWEIGAK